MFTFRYYGKRVLQTFVSTALSTASLVGATHTYRLNRERAPSDHLCKFWKQRFETLLLINDLDHESMPRYGGYRMEDTGRDKKDATRSAWRPAPDGEVVEVGDHHREP